MERTWRNVLGAVLSVGAGAGLWSLAHEIARIGTQGHGHESPIAHLTPHHLVTILGPLTPLLILIAVALRAGGGQSARVSRGGGRELLGAVAILEAAELLSGSIDHGWMTTVALLGVAASASWLLSCLALRVIRAVEARMSTPLHLARGQRPRLLLRHVDDIGHPIRRWLALCARRGPPARRPRVAA